MNARWSARREGIGWALLLAAALWGGQWGCARRPPAVYLEVPKGFTEMPSWAGRRFRFIAGSNHEQAVLRRLEAKGPSIRLESDRSVPWAAITVSRLTTTPPIPLREWARVVRCNAPDEGGRQEEVNGEVMAFCPIAETTVGGMPCLRWTATSECKGRTAELSGVVFSKAEQCYLVTMVCYPRSGPGDELDARYVANEGFKQVLRTLDVPSQP